MDVETSAAIERLTERIDLLDATVREGFVSVRRDLGGEIATLRQDLGGEIATMRRDLDDLREETRDGLAENRRHTELLFESLRGDIRILAEGFASVSLKLDSLQR